MFSRLANVAASPIQSLQVSHPDKTPQRRGHRVRPGPLRAEIHGGASGTLVDLSEYGALLELPGPERVGSRLSFDLHWDDAPLVMHGRVVRSTPRYEGSWRVEWMEPLNYQVAVEFFDIAAQSTTTLRELLRKAGEGQSTDPITDR
jgi:hypothetical protein